MRPVKASPEVASPGLARRLHRLAALLALAAGLSMVARAGVAVMGIEGPGRGVGGDPVVLHDLIADPIEPVNRGVFGFTKGAVDMAIEPLGRGWSCVVPRPGRKALDKVSRNVAYPVRLVALLLQGRVADSGQETGHFLVNTTLGVAGLWDPAGRLGIPTYSEDLGQAFGAWGLDHGFYLFLPLMGPSSGRDGLGQLADTALSPTTYVPGLGWFFAFNRISLHLDAYGSLRASKRDLYSASRMVWAVHRLAAVQDYQIPESAYASADADPSVQVLALKAQDGDFLARSRTGSARIASTGARLPYSAWMQKRPAPLVLLLPGIGGHRQGSTSVALAETLFRGGCSVVTLSSVFHAEFMLRALSHPYPGHTPTDVRDVHAALAAVAAAVDARWGGRITEISLLGTSLGALQALFLAAGEPVPLPGGRHFTRVVAVNPPVDILAASQHFDRFYDLPLAWPQHGRQKRLEDIALRAYVLVTEGIPEGRPLPFSRDESRFLVGLGGREVLAAALRAQALYGAKERPPVLARDAVEAMNAMPFRRYLDEYLIPACQAKQPGTAAERLLEEASLRAVAGALTDDQRVRIVTNADDFVLGEGEAQWLRQTFGADRVTVFPSGGHLGNLAEPYMQQAILMALGCAATPSAGEPMHNAQ